MLFYPRQAILAPIGLITDPNEYGQYGPGALKSCRNQTLRLPGKLVQAPNIDTASIHVVGPVDAILYKLMPADTGVVYSIVSDLSLFSIFADGVLQTFIGSNTPVTAWSFAFSETGRITWAQCVDRVIVNGKGGNLVRDPVSLSTNFRAAGLPQIYISILSLSADGWLDVDQAVQYRACLVRRYSQDYTLRSAPSVVYRIRNTAAPKKNVGLRITLPLNSGIEPGDIIEIYRTNILSTTSDYADTGDTYKLVQEYTITNVDIAAGFAQLDDTQPPALGTLVTTGRELYTNPGVEGETYANERPPVAKVLVTFKGFVFYANTIERAQLKFGIPGGWGITSASVAGGISLVTAREAGIGNRTGAGTIVAGNDTITAVPAADMIGVQVGQRWGAFSALFPGGTTVISKTATTIRMSNNALAPGAAWTLDDVIEIAGVNYLMRTAKDFVLEANGKFELQLDTALADNTYLSGFEFTAMMNYHPLNSVLQVRATNGANYSPPLPELTATVKDIDPIERKNRIAWSKEQQPEHQPSVSETLAGFGEIYAANATRDCVWFWCSDGLYRLSGNAGSLGLGAWQLDYANATLLLCAPQASTVLEDKLYGYTNEGVVELDSAGNISKKTEKILGTVLPGPRYRETAVIIMDRNEHDNEVLLAVGEDPDFATRLWIFNARQNGWTYLDDNDDELSAFSAIAMFRLPPGGAEKHVLLGTSVQNGVAPQYASWNADDSFLEGEGQYQPIYGNDPLELKRWMWTDYLFDVDTYSATPRSISAVFNESSFGPVPMARFDTGVYARAGVPRDMGLSHAISPGFSWTASIVQRRFEGLSIAVKQRTNQSKQR